MKAGRPIHVTGSPVVFLLGSGIYIVIYLLFTNALHGCRVGILYAGYLLQVSFKLINRSNIL